MLAQVLAMAWCLSVTSRCCIEMVGRIELVFLHGVFAELVLQCFVRKLPYLQKCGTSPWNFS